MFVIELIGHLARVMSLSVRLFGNIFGKEKIGVLRAPSAVAVGADERLYVADGTSGVVHMFGLKKRQYMQFSSLGDGQTLMMPVDLAVIGGRIYVVDSVRHEVCFFDNNGK